MSDLRLRLLPSHLHLTHLTHHLTSPTTSPTSPHLTSSPSTLPLVSQLLGNVSVIVMLLLRLTTLYISNYVSLCLFLSLSVLSCSSPSLSIVFFPITC